MKYLYLPEEEVEEEEVVVAIAAAVDVASAARRSISYVFDYNVVWWGTADDNDYDIALIYDLLT